MNLIVANISDFLLAIARTPFQQGTRGQILRSIGKDLSSESSGNVPRTKEKGCKIEFLRSKRRLLKRRELRRQDPRS
jgi:hypothetical protein